MSSRKSLNDAEQFIFQQFLNNGVLDQFSFKDLFRNVLNKFQIKYNSNDNDEFKKKIVSYLKSINESLKPYSLEIKNGTCEISGITFYCLVRLYDSVGTLSQLYSQHELKLFKKILNLIIEADDSIIDYHTIASGVADDEEMKYSNKEIREITDKFVRDYWLLAIGGKYALHSRTILELSEYLKEIYGQDVIVSCKLCKEIVICGISCESCTAKMHRHCAKKFFKNQSDCPVCKNPMSDEQIGAFRGDTSGSSSSNNNRTQSASTSQRDVKNVTLINDSDTNKRKKN